MFLSGVFLCMLEAFAGHRCDCVQVSLFPKKQGGRSVEATFGMGRTRWVSLDPSCSNRLMTFEGIGMQRIQLRKILLLFGFTMFPSVF